MFDVTVSSSRSVNLVPVLVLDHPSEPVAPHGGAPVALLDDREEVRGHRDRAEP